MTDSDIVRSSGNPHIIVGLPSCNTKHQLWAQNDLQIDVETESPSQTSQLNTMPISQVLIWYIAIAGQICSLNCETIYCHNYCHNSYTINSSKRPPKLMTRTSPSQQRTPRSPVMDGGTSTNAAPLEQATTDA